VQEYRFLLETGPGTGREWRIYDVVGIPFTPASCFTLTTYGRGVPGTNGVRNASIFGGKTQSDHERLWSFTHFMFVFVATQQPPGSLFSMTATSSSWPLSVVSTKSSQRIDGLTEWYVSHIRLLLPVPLRPASRVPCPGPSQLPRLPFLVFGN
jgi:hypothetical protein